MLICSFSVLYVYCCCMNVMQPGEWHAPLLQMPGGAWCMGCSWARVHAGDWKACVANVCAENVAQYVARSMVFDRSQGGCLSKSCILQIDVSSCEQIWGSLCEMSCFECLCQQVTHPNDTVGCDVQWMLPCNQDMVWCLPHRVYRQSVGLDVCPIILLWDQGCGGCYTSDGFFLHWRLV